MMECCCGLPHDLLRRGLLAMAFAATVMPRRGQAAPVSAGPLDAALLDDLVVANHILFDQGVVDGFGHVSVRHDKSPNRYLLARSMAPVLVTRDDIMEYDLDSVPVDPRGRTSYLERFIHGELYKVRPDVIAIVHSHSPAVIPFADTKVKLRPMNHMSSFLGAGAPVFDISDTAGPATDMLIRNPSLGHALAEAMGDHPVMLMRGHGSVAAAQSLHHVVYRAVYTEVNARMEAEAMQLGPVTFLSPQEAAAASKTVDTLVERPWAMWKQHAMAKS